MAKEPDKKLLDMFVETSKEIQTIETKISTAIANFQTQLEEKRKQEETLKEALKVVMVKDGIKKFENDVISLTYVAPYTKKTLDSTKLKEEAPEVYEKYSKVSEVADRVNIKVK